jgi:hypothetical protein
MTEIDREQVVLDYWKRKLENFNDSWPLGIAVIGSVALSLYLLHLEAVSG